ncbi:MAG TPA: hypothetical protein VK518_07540 [Puia sp.]|nr:hypothetical protein [Puia sp.]
MKRQKPEDCRIDKYEIVNRKTNCVVRNIRGVDKGIDHPFPFQAVRVVPAVSEGGGNS